MLSGVISLIARVSQVGTSPGRLGCRARRRDLGNQKAETIRIDISTHLPRINSYSVGCFRSDMPTNTTLRITKTRNALPILPYHRFHGRNCIVILHILSIAPFPSVDNPVDHSTDWVPPGGVGARYGAK